MERSAAPSAAAEFSAHWRVVAASSVGMGVGLTMFSYVQSIFVTEMQHAFGWTRGDMAFAMAALLLGALTAPLLGWLIDRWGVRRVVLVSMACTALCLALLAAVSAAIWTYYLAFCLLIVLGSGTTPISYARAVSTWFDKGLGLALAIALSGVSLAAFVLPPVLTAVIGQFGWRAGYLFLAALPLLIGLPISALWLFERADAPVIGAVGPPVQGMSAGQALRDRRFWIMALAITLVTVPAISLASQLQPLLTDKGFSPATAASLLSLFALSVLAGRIVIGQLFDRFWAPGVACGILLISSIGAFLLIGPGGSYGACALSLMLLGMAQGAEINLQGFLIARYFGMRSFSAIYGNLNVVFGLAIAAGAVMFGKLYDLYGNYDLGLRIGGCFLIGSALLFPMMGRYPVRDEPT